ncbi:MAG: cytochrome o ubiquinol oxidase subunit III [Pseudolabrys sp.]|jgi:cytochrome o ubiquinol oxidase subunit III
MAHATATTEQYAELLQEEQKHQLDERAFGFWLYLMSDALIFSLLFATYAVMVGRTAGGPQAHGLFDLRYTFGETMLLLFSSTTFGLAGLSIRAKNKGAVLFWLAVTFLLGAGFVGMEINEFHGMVVAGAAPERSGFLSAFFTLVATHGLHVTCGLVWIVVLGAEVLRKGLTAPVASRIHRLGLFWHFLDIIWIAIFSVVYLPGSF